MEQTAPSQLSETKCWCKGRGERQIIAGDPGQRYVAGVEYCPCERGVDAKVAWEARKAALNQRRAERLAGRAARVEEYLWQSRIPPRFVDCTLASFPSPKAAWFQKFLRLQANPADDDDWDAYTREFPKWNGVFLYGLPGRGKTGVAAAALRAQIEHDAPGLFVVVPEWLAGMRASYGGGKAAIALETLCDTPNLVLDDLGVERGTDWAQETLFTLINHRHDHELWTLCTSNLDLDALAERIGERSAWRIAEMCTVFHVEGPNLRLPEAKR